MTDWDCPIAGIPSGLGPGREGWNADDGLKGESMNMEKILTAKELSQFLKLSESTIYKLASNGEIPGFKIGDSWRFDLEEIQKMIRESKKRRLRLRSPLEGREERAEKRLSD